MIDHETFFDVGLIEKWGSGIGRMRKTCVEAGLPEPEFKDRLGMWITFRKDIFNENHLRDIGLKERQVKAVLYVKSSGSINNSMYQKITGVKKRQASDDLKHLEELGILERMGTTGKGTLYTLKSQRGIKGAPKGR